MEIASLAAVVGIVKTLKEITNSPGDAVSPKVREQVVALSDRLLEMQGAALDAQEREIRLTKRCSQLEKEIGRLNDWKTEEDRHILKQIESIASVYMPTPRADSPEKPYWLCPNCFEDRKKSFLQPQEISETGREWRCARCPTTFTLNYIEFPRW